MLFSCLLLLASGSALGSEDIAVKPDNGEACECVPYYQCDEDLNAASGTYQIDISDGVDECPESVERCCKNPKAPEPLPGPDSSTLRGCGYRNRKGVDFTITGGTGAEAQFGEFPWVVAVIDAQNGSYLGAGVLLHPQVVMTTAHILYKFQPGALKIRAGEWDTQSDKERLQSQERMVKDMFIHPGFNIQNARNDWALLRLQEPVNLADHINVICLPEQDENFDSSRDCVVNGWGKETFGLKGRRSVILKREEINMVQHDKCNELLQNTQLGHDFQLHKRFVCAGGEGKDTCQDDDGAPLVCPIGDDRYKLTGLAGWRIGCGERDVPALFVNVAAFRDLIDGKMARWGIDTSGYNV